MKRREFLQAALGSAVAAVIPIPKAEPKKTYRLEIDYTGDDTITICGVPAQVINEMINGTWRPIQVPHKPRRTWTWDELTAFNKLSDQGPPL
jgi:hypothetical protein